MIEKMLRWIVIGGIFALPFLVFIVANTLFFPFITGKNIAFRIIVEVITGAWLALAVMKPEYRPRKSWLLAAFAAFVVVIAVADLNGVNPFKSFWSNFERMDGWVTLIHLFAYFVVASTILSTKELWRRFLQTSLGVSVLAGLYGILQFAGVAALGQGGASGLSGRLDGTFGNPIYLAAFMLFNIFIAAFLWSQSWRERQSGSRLGISLWYGGVMALDTIILFSTGTRGTILGLIGGTLLTVFLIAIFDRAGGLARRIGVSVAIALLVLGSVFWVVRDQAWVQKVGFMQRLATISISDATVKARIMNWGMAWEGVKERPVLGWGQENYAIVFDKYYNPQMYAQEQWFDRVHNIVFDWLVAGGFLGLISYLMLFVCALWCIWSGGANNSLSEQQERQREKRIDGNTGTFSLVEQGILTGLLAGYFFHNLFVFDNISSYLLFTTVLAYVVSRFTTVRNASVLFQSVKIPSSAMPVIAGIAIVLVWGTALHVNGRALAQNRALLQAIAPQQGGITENLRYFKEAVGYGSLGTQEAREQLAQIASQLAVNQQVPDDVKKQFFDLGVSEMMLQEEMSPLDARFPLFEGVLRNAYGDTAGAEKAFERALKLSPTKQTILFELGANAQSRGNDSESLAYFKKALDLAPEFQTARIYYASSLIRAKQDSLADEVLAPIIQSGAAADPNIAAAYVAIGRYDKIVTIWTAKVKAEPGNTQARFTLAAALFAEGKPAGAISELEEAKRINPDAATQADEFIKQIKEGRLIPG
jgi:O-antigen ligase/tetratricopeptide (TPR) repeat protein